jgi:hypothetical protein
MRKLIILTAIVAIAVTAVIWSIATVARPKFVGRAEEAPAPISSHDIMVKQGKSIPVEYWAHPF